MSEFTPLRAAVDTLASRTPSPDFGELKRRATRRRRRRVVMVAAAGAVAVIALGGALAAGTPEGSDQPSPIGEPTTPSSESPTVQEGAVSTAPSGEDLEALLAQAPDWAPTWVSTTAPYPDLRDFHPYGKGPCSGNWTRGASVVVGDPSRGEVTMSYAEVSRHPAGIFVAGFASDVHASDAANRLVENLHDCTATAWRTEPLAQTGAVLASSPEVVAWIHQTGADVEVLQVPTTDGPPPEGIQVEAAAWLVAYATWEDQQRPPEP